MRSLNLTTRLVALVCTVALAGAAFSQTFTIRRPQDGSVVREVVQVRIPKNSVPPGSYVGFWINGKFLEAVGLDSTDIRENDYVYNLNTKARKLPDGKLAIEAVLYADFEEAPRIVNRSSVEVTLDNSNSIKVPPNGFVLRYAFHPGMKLTYNLEAKVTESTITEIQNQLGGRASEEMLDTQKIRVLYAYEQQYKLPTGNEMLIRMQPLPPKGKDYAIVNLSDTDEPRRYYEYEMASLYMRITDTGREVFGSYPFYTPMEGSMGQGSTTDLFVSLPWPVLPTKGVKPGDKWQAAFQNGVDDRGNLYETNRVSIPFPASGTLESVEWENGIPSAKIRNEISVGTTSEEGKALMEMGRAFADDKITLDETVWFALDKRILTKLVRTITIERKVGAEPAGGGGGGGRPGGLAPAGGRGGLMGGPPGGDDDDRDNKVMSPPQRGSRGGLMGGPGGPATGGAAGSGPAGGGRAAAGGGRGSNTEYQRIRIQLVLTLEK